MARSVSFESPVVTNVECTSNNSGGGGNNLRGGTNSGRSVAEVAIDGYLSVSSSIGGSNLPGYDIKSQDALTMIRLSLVASTDGQFLNRELYIDNRGLARVVEVGTRNTTINERDLRDTCLSVMSIGNYLAPTDYVVVQGADPVPSKIMGPIPVNLMGAGKLVDVEATLRAEVQGSAPPGVSIDGLRPLGMEAWAAFERSEQSPETQELITDAINRPDFNELVGWKAIFHIGDTTRRASLSPSQTVPQILKFNMTNPEMEITPPAISSAPEDNGVTDIAGVSVASAPVVDLVTGPNLESMITGDIGNLPPSYQFGENYIYVLLDNKISITNLSRGENWFMTGGEDAATIHIQPSSSSDLAAEAFDGISASNTTKILVFFRKNNDESGNRISSFSDFINRNVSLGSPHPLHENGGAHEEAFPSASIFSGFGGSNGMEIFASWICYTIAGSSIQVRSSSGGAGIVAQNLANGGVNYFPILIHNPPAPVALASADGSELVEPVRPQNEPGDPICPESKTETLEGRIINMVAPWLGSEGVVGFASELYRVVNVDGPMEVRTYAGHTIAATLLPGQELGDGDGVVHSVEFNYADQDSQTTSITIGPPYYQVNSYNDSKYIKRSETITRDAVVLAGSHDSGIFTVLCDEGTGQFNAIVSDIRSVYVGDRVQVKILNYPIEA